VTNRPLEQLADLGQHLRARVGIVELVVEALELPSPAGT